MPFEETQPLKTIRPAGVAAGLVLLLVLCGLSFSGASRFSDAETLWLDVIRQNPSAWMARGNLARLLAERGRSDEALEHYRAVTEINPALAEGFFNLGVEYLARGRPEEAAASFREALLRNRRLSQAHQALGFALVQMERHREALESFLMVTALNPGRPEGHYGAGIAMAALNRHEKAVEEFDMALKLMDESTPALDRAEVFLQKGISLEGLGRQAEALASFREAALAAPGYSRPFHRMGVALARLGRPVEAARALEKAVLLEPDFAPAGRDLEIVRNSLADRGQN